MLKASELVVPWEVQGNRKGGEEKLPEAHTVLKDRNKPEEKHRMALPFQSLCKTSFGFIDKDILL